jgi:hypothetical protein
MRYLRRHVTNKNRANEKRQKDKMGSGNKSLKQQGAAGALGDVAAIGLEHTRYVFFVAKSHISAHGNENPPPKQSQKKCARSTDSRTR